MKKVLVQSFWKLTPFNFSRLTWFWHPSLVSCEITQKNVWALSLRWSLSSACFFIPCPLAGLLWCCSLWSNTRRNFVLLQKQKKMFKLFETRKVFPGFSWFSGVVDMTRETDWDFHRIRADISLSSLDFSHHFFCLIFALCINPLPHIPSCAVQCNHSLNFTGYLSHLWAKSFILWMHDTFTPIPQICLPYEVVIGQFLLKDCCYT